MMFYLSILFALLLGLFFGIFLFQNISIKSRLLLNLFIPIGIGLSSAIYISLNLINFPFLLICAIELIAIGVLFIQTKNNLSPFLKPKFSINTLFQQPILLLLTVVYFYAWILDTSIFFFDSIKEPHGLWDAWNYWNLKAKFISKAPDEWPALFHQMISEDFHVDYPLLQTGFIARCWRGLQNDPVWVPILLAYTFTFCTIGLLSSAVGHFTNNKRGLIAGLIMLATPFFMVMGDSQYADNTVGFFYLATIVLLTFARNEKETSPQLYIAVGITASLSAWSKNEGLLFITCLFASQLTLIFTKKPIVLFNELKYILIGALPILLLIFYYKTAIAPPNDIVSAQGESTLVKLKDTMRYSTIFDWHIQTFGTFGKWFMNPWWLFLGAIIYNGINLKKYKTSNLTNLTLILLMVLGFFMIYVITPLPLVFHLSTSIHRLFFQLFPSFIFVYFLFLKERDTTV
ncbi:MAG: glycosyltransferase family 39 protein [Bacteroidia bacterium]